MPLIWTLSPSGPRSGFNDFSVGAALAATLGATLEAMTTGASAIPLALLALNATPLLSCPAEATTTRPPDPPAGTATWISRSLQ